MNENNFCSRCGKRANGGDLDIHTCTPPQSYDQTHYDGCWMTRGHHDCAIRRVQKLEEENILLRKQLADACGNVLEKLGFAR